MILKYLKFINEIRRSKLDYFRNSDISEKFTSSIEIEIETLDNENVDSDYSESYIEDIIDKIRNSVTKELKRIDGFQMTESISEFIENLLEEIRMENDDYEFLIDELLESEEYEDIEFRPLIVELMRQQVLTYFFSDNFEYLESKFQENFSSFYIKNKDLIKFEIDNTLERGIELSNKTYFESINDLIKFINEFYEEFNRQNYWIFSERTGIHINLGLKYKSDYNFIKGLLFLNDEGESPFVFKNMQWRENSKFCGSLLKKLKEDKNFIEQCKFALTNKNNLFDLESRINSKLKNILKDAGYKNFGVNLVPLDKFNYIEFRYAGGKIDKETLIDKLLYFSYIVFLMTEKNFDRREYLKKLYKFLNE